MSPEEKANKELWEFIQSQDYMSVCPRCKKKSFYNNIECVSCRYSPEGGFMKLNGCKITTIKIQPKEGILEATITMKVDIRPKESDKLSELSVNKLDISLEISETDEQLTF